MLSCPTLLATIEDDLPELRFLLVSGEACPQDLIARWHRPGRRFLNVYGPTEATVTATWTTLDPDRPVTIGQPLPTYTTVILDPDDPSRALPPGEVGEIGHRRDRAGAAGYLNRDDLTEKAFIPDFLGIPDNPSGPRSTAPATSAGSTRPARSSTSAGSTCRSRSAATGSS